MMRKRFAFLAVLALVLFILPLSAFADDGFSGSDGGSLSNSDGGVVYTAYGDNDTYKVYVRADNKWQAAVYACGGDPSLLSSEIRSKLSDPSYGGDFYAYAQTFEVMDNPLEFPPWVLFSLPFFSNISDYMKSEVSNSLYTSALVDYKVILGGGSVGGGGSGGGSGGNVSDYSEVVMDCTDTVISGSSYVRDFTCTRATVDSSGNVVVGSGTAQFSAFVGSSHYASSARFFVSPAWLSLANQFISQGKHVLVGVSPYASPPAGYYMFVCDSYSVVRKVNAGSQDQTVDFLVFDNGSFYASRGNAMYADGIGPFFVVLPDSEPSGFTSVSEVVVAYWAELSTTVNPPSGDWPEPTTPVNPDPPEIPTPTAPTETVDPNPTAPTITWPTSPTLVLPTSPIVSTTPDGIDYTALLTLINDNLNSIDAYLQNFYTSFNSFRSDFLNGIDDIVDGLRNIYQYLGHLNNILEVHCKHITDQIEESVYNLELYIKRLFEWLPKQLNFDAEFDYDDSAVTTLLRRILNKIPGGSTGTPVSYKPNPQSDTPGFFDWLADLWHRFLIDLVSVLPDELGGLVDTISQLTHYFPFSIPWDMFALLALFAHDPVTPVFDVPWGYGGDEGEVQMIRVDLSAWDGVMETVRPVFLVGFCMQLAMITKDLLANFDLKQGGV